MSHACAGRPQRASRRRRRRRPIYARASAVQWVGDGNGGANSAWPAAGWVVTIASTRLSRGAARAARASARWSSPGLPTVLHVADHAHLPHAVLDLGRRVGNEAVLAVESVRARIGIGDPERRRLRGVDDGLQQRSRSARRVTEAPRRRRRRAARRCPRTRAWPRAPRHGARGPGRACSSAPERGLPPGRPRHRHRAAPARPSTGLRSRRASTSAPVLSEHPGEAASWPVVAAPL